MGTANIKALASTWIQSTTPNASNDVGPWLRATEGTAKDRAFVRVLPGLPVGTQVLSATLTFFAAPLNAASAWGNLTLTQVTQSMPLANMTWNRQPTLGTVGAASPTTLAPGTTTDGQALVFDVTAMVQQWVNGVGNFGLQLRNSGTVEKAVYSTRSAFPPVLHVTFTTRPDVPQNLIPAGTTSLAKPVLQFGPFHDANGDALQAVRVHVANSTAGWTAANGFPTPTFNSGWVTTSTPSLDLSATAFAGFSGTTQYWTCQVQDSTGSASKWADPVAVTRTGKPTITMSSPSSGSPIVREMTPQIVWTATGQTSFRVRILDGTTRAELGDSGRITDTTGQWGVPAGVITPTGSYIAQVRVWDITRSPSPGDLPYAQAEQPFTFSRSGSGAPTGVTCAQGPDWPGQVLVTCTQTTAPDYFTVYLDGEAVLTNVAPGDAVVSGTTYQFEIDHCPRGSHKFEVDAVTAGVASAASTPVFFNNQIRGIWLGSPSRKLWIVLMGTESIDGFSFKDEVTVTAPIDGTIPQQIIRAMGGLSGSCSGVIAGASDLNAPSTYIDAAMRLKEQPQDTLRLVYATTNIPVKVSNLSVSPRSEFMAQDPQWNVSFDFFQCDQLGFKPRL